MAQNMRPFAFSFLFILIIFIGRLETCLANSKKIKSDACARCLLRNQPVCSSSAITFMNGCLASCQGVARTIPGACPGTYNFTRQTTTSEQSFETVSAKTISKYYSDGFFYTGTIPISKIGRDPRATLTFARSPVHDILSKMVTGGDLVGTRAVRVTPEGHIYVAAAQSFVQAKEHDLHRTPSASNQNSSRLESWQHVQLSRKEGGLDQVYERSNSAIGQLAFQGEDYTYLCTASFVSPQDVLTAAHCVYDAVKGVAYTDWTLTLAVNDSQVITSRIINQYDYVTIYQNYMAGGVDIDYWDMALIRTRVNHSKFITLGLLHDGEDLENGRSCSYTGTKTADSNYSLLCSNCSASSSFSNLSGMLLSSSYPSQTLYSGSPLLLPDKPAILGVLSGSPEDEYWISYWTPMDALHRNSVIHWVAAGSTSKHAPKYELPPLKHVPSASVEAASMPTPEVVVAAALASEKNVPMPSSPVPSSFRLCPLIGCPTVPGTSLRESAFLITYACSGAVMLLMLLA